MRRDHRRWLLFVVAADILSEIIGRFRNPPEVASGDMLVVAAIGHIARPP